MKAAVLYELNQPVVVDDIDMEGPKRGKSLLRSPQRVFVIVATMRLQAKSAIHFQ